MSSWTPLACWPRVGQLILVGGTGSSGSPSRDGVGRQVRKPSGWSPELRVRVLQKVEFNRRLGEQAEAARGKALGLRPCLTAESLTGARVLETVEKGREAAMAG